ncbi:MAG: GumC family protein [Ignavibacteriaceae bacterium]
MSKERSLEFLDFIVLIVKRKKFLLVLAVISCIVAYLSVYFLIKPEYESTATIIPSQENSIGMLGALSEKLSSLPFGLGGTSSSAQMELYTTIIYSRTTIENVINKFNLMNEYHFENMESADKAVRKMIKAEVTTGNAFDISVFAKTPQMAAEITNYVVGILNKSIIKLNVSKAKDNREFLEKRYDEIKLSLKNAEDSLKNYQKKSGVLEAEEQTKQTIDTFAKLEAELATKQVENSVLKHVYGETSNQVANSQMSLNIFQNKVNELERTGDKSGLFLALNSIPDKALNYYRRYRDVEIYNKMLEYIIPLYEQSKFEEQKDTPILQVIDYGIPPLKKSYPPRVLFSLIITLVTIILVLIYLILKEIITGSQNPKVEFIREEIFKFRQKPSVGK